MARRVGLLLDRPSPHGDIIVKAEAGGGAHLAGEALRLLEVRGVQHGVVHLLREEESEADVGGAQHDQHLLQHAPRGEVRVHGRRPCGNVAHSDLLQRTTVQKTWNDATREKGRRIDEGYEDEWWGNSMSVAFSRIHIILVLLRHTGLTTQDITHNNLLPNETTKWTFK